MLSIKTTSLVVIIMAAISFILSIYSLIVASEELVTGTNLYRTWMLIFSFLVAIWAVEDKKLEEKEKNFSYGFLVLILWPVLLLYHLIKSRGIEGLLVYMGFWALYVLPNFLNIVAQFYV